MKPIVAGINSGLVLIIAITLGGCSGRRELPVVFEPNLVHTKKYEIKEKVPMDQASKDSTWITDVMFGTPDVPKLPQVVTDDPELASVVSMDRLMRAAGPVEPGRGHFRKLCVICHGVTGNGRGTTAAVQVPYPRDYRMGVFKFKSTARGAKPTRQDLERLIRNGIGGTAMKPVKELTKDEVTDEDITDLVDYVIYLSIRGQLERQVVDMAILDGIIQDGERIINSDLGKKLLADPAYAKQLESLAEKNEDELSEAEQEELAQYQRYQEDWGYAEEYVVEIVESWLDSDDATMEVPDPPGDIPVAESYADVQAFRSGDQADAFAKSVQRGEELFVGKLANCFSCHGKRGLGDGQTTDYDDWTKDWTIRVGLDPKNREALIPLLARGALPPINAKPRNFAEGIFRGGSSSKDLYRRIVQGIDGTPMPAATFVTEQFEQEDVWHLINFVRSLQTAESAASQSPGQDSQPSSGSPVAARQSPSVLALDPS